MIVNVSYSLAALHAAAKFIWENNRSVPQWPSKPTSVFDVMESIKKMIRDGARDNAKVLIEEMQYQTRLHDDWVDFNGTGGYYIYYDLRSSTDEEIFIDATILVSPSVSHPFPAYIVEGVDINGKNS